jgi:hypothetical protein
MFKKKTVLILGAGASVPYGYPTGAGLVEEVKAAANNLIENVLEADIGRKSVQDFINTLNRYNPINIDYFLHQLYGDHEQTGDKTKEKMLELGRELIATVILMTEHKTESGNICYQKTENDQKNFDMSQDWYRSLRHDLLSDGALEREKERDDGLLPKKLENSLKNLKIITFNYDVSLEYYLYDTLSLVLDKISAQEVLEKLEILHVYGQIRGGDSPLKIADYGDSSSDYKRSWQSAPESAPHISVIGEHKSKTTEDTTVTAKAEEMLKDAETLAFFGFGFDEKNLEMLGLNDNNPLGWKWDLGMPQLPNQAHPLIFYTNYGDRGKVDRAISRLFPIFSADKAKLIFRKSTGSVAKALADDFDLL